MRFLNNKVTKLVALGIVLGVIFSYLLIQLPWFPPADSTQATRTDRLTYGITYVSGAIFGLVMIVMAYCIWKFRRRGPDDMRDGDADPRAHRPRDPLDGDPRASS